MIHVLQVMSHVSHVMSHVLHVMIHVSHVLSHVSHVTKYLKHLKGFVLLGMISKAVGGGGGQTSNFGALFRSFNHARLFKSAGIKFSVQRNSTLAKANKKIYYAVLSLFAKFPYLLLRNCLKKRGKGVQPNRAMPIF